MQIEQYLNASPFYVIEKSYKALQKQISKDLSKDDLTHHQALILIAVFLEKSKFVSPKVLAESFKLSKASISHLLSHLEQRKYLKRKITNEDARSFQIILTEAGRKKATKLITLFDKMQKDWESKLGENNLNNLMNEISIFQTGPVK